MQSIELVWSAAKNERTKLPQKNFGMKRPRNPQIQEGTTGIRDKGMNNMEWIDGEEWGRNVKLYARKDVKTSKLCR